jgi:hypothetical protein
MPIFKEIEDSRAGKRPSLKRLTYNDRYGSFVFGIALAQRLTS